MTQPQPGHTPSPVAIQQQFRPSPEAVAAVLTAIVLQRGEPLVEPIRVSYSIGRPAIEAAAGRMLTFEYVQDELNPFGRLDIIVLE